MQLVIIAGGLGKRLRPLTLNRPKALIPLVDRPLVVHLLDSLPPSCDEAIIAVNYMYEQVRDFFREHEFRVAVRVVAEPVPLGTAGGPNHGGGAPPEGLRVSHGRARTAPRPGARGRAANEPGRA